MGHNLFASKSGVFIYKKSRYMCFPFCFFVWLPGNYNNRVDQNKKSLKNVVKVKVGRTVNRNVSEI